MNNLNNKVIAVKILDRDYHFKCRPEEAAKLKQAVAYLDAKMRKIHGSSNAVSLERTAIMAAVDVCYELMCMRVEKDADTKAMYERIKNLQTKLENVISDK